MEQDQLRSSFMSQDRFKITVSCRSQEDAKVVAQKLKHFSRRIVDVVVKLIGSVVEVTFRAVGISSLTLLGNVRDLLGMHYSPSIREV
jgi:CDP-diacylglycerol pyrophosphatase